MKKILPYLLLSVVCFCCNKKLNEPKHSVSITAIVDITDKLKLLPDPESILSLYGFDTDENIEGYFRLTNLTDKQLNSDHLFHLPDGFTTEKNNSLDDPNYRENCIVSFYNDIETAITNFNAKCRNESSLNNSECFRIIAGEIKKIKQINADKSILLVFSDLQENSDLFNCYTATGQKILHEDTDTITAKFEATHLLPDNLKNIEIVFVFEPRTRLEDQNYAALISSYRKLLEPRGATVKVRADNNYSN